MKRLTNDGREINNWSSNEKGTPGEKMLTRTALAVFGGAAALVLAGLVVLAVVVGVVLVFAAISPPPTSARVTSAPPAPAAVAPGSNGVHIASLTNCIDGLNC